MINYKRIGFLFFIQVHELSRNRKIFGTIKKFMNRCYRFMKIVYEMKKNLQNLTNK